jgi:FMN-binding domain
VLPMRGPSLHPPLVLAAVLLVASAARAQEGVYLTEDQAPRAVFRDAERVERTEVASSAALRARMDEHLRGTAVSVWEPRYVVFHVERAGVRLGDAVVVEEIGKHRPITFVVGIRPDGTIEDVAVMAYREAYGGEIRQQRFLAQYRGKGATDDLKPYGAIKNVAGATLSVEAASRAVRKAQALLLALAKDPS